VNTDIIAFASNYIFTHEMLRLRKFWAEVSFAYSWCISQPLSNNKRAHEMVNHSTLQNRCLHTRVARSAFCM